jgi:hypothetical protein
MCLCQHREIHVRYNIGMDSLQDLLGRYSPKEPDEIGAVKQYIMDAFKAEATVGLHGETLVITVASASLANALRLRLLTIQKIAKTDRKIMFRIS